MSANVAARFGAAVGDADLVGGVLPDLDRILRITHAELQLRDPFDERRVLELVTQTHFGPSLQPDFLFAGLDGQGRDLHDPLLSGRQFGNRPEDGMVLLVVLPLLVGLHEPQSFGQIGHQVDAMSGRRARIGNGGFVRDLPLQIPAAGTGQCDLDLRSSDFQLQAVLGQQSPLASHAEDVGHYARRLRGQQQFQSARLLGEQCAHFEFQLSASRVHKARWERPLRG